MKNIKINNKKWIDSDEAHKKWMKESEYRQEYEKLKPEFQIARQIIEARIKQKITQIELARRMGTGQAVVSRLEGANAKPSISLLHRLAKALNQTIKIKIKPI